MKCTRVEFNGYKRLIDASCSLDDRLIAFVGPNEAGKSTVLQGMAWLDLPASDPLPDGVASRGQPVGSRQDDDTIVLTKFRLEPEDWKALEHLSYKRTRDTYTYSFYRQRNGSRIHSIRPKFVRLSEPFERARKALGRAPRALEDALVAADEVHEAEDEAPPERTLHETCLALLDGSDHVVEGGEVDALRKYALWLGQVGNDDSKPSLVAAGEAVIEVANVLGSDHPNDEALSILDKRRPRFREFNAADRELENEVDITEEESALSAAFTRVLDLAGTDVDHLREIWSDEGERDTHLGDCNRTLNEFFSKAWTQSNLSVHLKAEHHLLKIQVTVVEGGKTYFSTFGERSDGLKAFVALVAFLHSLPDDQAPILLVDEADTHLHLDAQADLIGVLQDRVAATQILYTTHSPGCLPLDLGRGLRFVEPTEQHHSSTLSHNFWDSKYPGFSAVLFKMGASAFAFSALRQAVLAEGPADMILLPRLIRDATGNETLPYQVAPRMNDFDETDVGRHDIATSVAYLVDGDQGGRDRRKNLKRKHNVPAELIVSHPPGFAVEDYVDPATVLEVVNDIRTDAKKDSLITRSDLPTGRTLGQQIDKWFANHHVQGPGKVAVATRLANMDDLKLRSGAKSKLQALHKDMLVALEHRTKPA